MNYMVEVINKLIDVGIFNKGIPDNDIEGITECPFCGGKFSYWQSCHNGRRGFSCHSSDKECKIGGTVWQE